MNNEKIYAYQHHGEIIEPKNNDIYTILKPGETIDVALCYASSKKEAVKKFKIYFHNTTVKNVTELNKLFFNSDKVCILTPY